MKLIFNSLHGPSFATSPAQSVTRPALVETADIRERLAHYLGAAVDYLRVLASGWETTVFEFTLASRSPLADNLPTGSPLVLRSYQGSRADDKGARESITVNRLASAGYPVPRPYLFEPGRTPLGAPFLIMDRVAGGPLFSIKSFPQAFKTFSLGFIAFVRAQTQLHRLGSRGLNLDDIPNAYAADKTPPTAPLLDRFLAIIAERIENGPLPGLSDALDRLRERAARFREAPASLVHMDFHPQNVIVKGMRVTGVIDWVNADHGDRHLDVATTSAILSTTAMDHPRWMRDNAIGNSLRALFNSLYLPLYHVMAPLEFDRLRYCQAVASLLRLSMLGMMRARGAEAAGFRPEAINEVTPMVVRLLSRYASRKSGVPVSIEPAPRSQVSY